MGYQSTLRLRNSLKIQLHRLIMNLVTRMIVRIEMRKLMKQTNLTKKNRMKSRKSWTTRAMIYQMQ
jgi:hypothetical protein